MEIERRGGVRRTQTRPRRGPGQWTPSLLAVPVLILTKRVCAGCCFADQTKAGGAGAGRSGGESLAVGWGRGARLGQRRLGLIHLLRGQIKLSRVGRSQQNMKENEGVTPVKDPWLSLGSDCGGLGWTGPRRPLKSLESLSSGQELGLTHSRVGSEEDCPQESWAPEGQSRSAVKPQLVLLVSVQSPISNFSYVCCPLYRQKLLSSMHSST